LNFRSRARKNGLFTREGADILLACIASGRPKMPSGAEALASAIFVEQIYSRCTTALLIEREISHSSNPAAALREIVEDIHKAIDFYEIDRPTPKNHLEDDKEQARRIVESVAQIVASLLGPRE
jgi:hypothetical protein